MFDCLCASVRLCLVEGAEPFAFRVRRALSDLAGREPPVAVALSRLTWLGCRVHPLREGNVAVLEAFGAFFQRPDMVWVDLSAQVIELATAIRARSRLKTPDALQAASFL